jgi:hypothetical protein
MATKYITNNATGQIINGDLTISGNLNITGSSVSSSIVNYRALLTQTGVVMGTNIGDFNYGLIIGETYTVTTYQSDDDFRNVADVQIGGISSFNYLWNSVPLIDGSFADITGTTSVSGYDAAFNVYITAGTSTFIEITSTGSNYIYGETITISGNDVGGSSPTNDIVITVSGLTPNSTGSVFIATGETPANWSNDTALTSDGGLIVDVLENSLGYDLEWDWNPFGGNGYYVAYNNNTGPLFNSFPRSKTEITTQIKYPYDFPFGIPPIGIPGVNSMIEKDSVLFIDMYYDGSLADNALYYTPVDIKIKQDPLTPVVVYGINVNAFPYGNISIDIFAGPKNVETLYGDYSLVNNMDELVAALNNDSTISYLGTFSVDPNVEDGIILTTTERIKNQFSPDDTFTFEAFND